MCVLAVLEGARSADDSSMDQASCTGHTRGQDRTSHEGGEARRWRVIRRRVETGSRSRGGGNSYCLYCVDEAWEGGGEMRVMRVME